MNGEHKIHPYFLLHSRVACYQALYYDAIQYTFCTPVIKNPLNLVFFFCTHLHSGRIKKKMGGGGGKYDIMGTRVCTNTASVKQRDAGPWPQHRGILSRLTPQPNTQTTTPVHPRVSSPAPSLGGLTMFPCPCSSP